MQVFAKAAARVLNERVLSAVAEAVGGLCRRTGPLAMREGVPILAAISARFDAPLAQRQAVEELEGLRR